LQNLSPRPRLRYNANVTTASAAGIRGARELRAVWLIKASQVKSNYRGGRPNDRPPPLLVQHVYRRDVYRSQKPLCGFKLSRTFALTSSSAQLFLIKTAAFFLFRTRKNERVVVVNSSREMMVEKMSNRCLFDTFYIDSTSFQLLFLTGLQRSRVCDVIPIVSILKSISGN